MTVTDKIKAWIADLDAVIVDTKETLRAGASKYGDSFSDAVKDPLARLEHARYLLFSMPYREPVGDSVSPKAGDEAEKLSAFLGALEEWGCVDHFDIAKHILEFQKSGYDLSEYMETEEGENGKRPALLTNDSLTPGLNFWQPIDSAPKDGTKIDLWVRIRPSKMEEPESYERFPASWWDSDRDDWKLGRLCWHSKFYADAHIPTHWMPSPTAPDVPA